MRASSSDMCDSIAMHMKPLTSPHKIAGMFCLANEVFANRKVKGFFCCTSCNKMLQVASSNRKVDGQNTIDAIRKCFGSSATRLIKKYSG